MCAVLTSSDWIVKLHEFKLDWILENKHSFVNVKSTKAYLFIKKAFYPAYWKLSISTQWKNNQSKTNARFNAFIF